MSRIIAQARSSKALWKPFPCLERSIHSSNKENASFSEGDTRSGLHEEWCPQFDVNESVLEESSKVYPEDRSKRWLSQQLVPSRYWKSEQNQLEYIKWLGTRLNIQKMEDWYQILANDILDNHGSGILETHCGSPSRLIRSVFPEHQWDQKRWNKGAIDELQSESEEMKRTPRHFVWDEKKWTRVIQHLEMELRINRPEEWYRVSRKQISEVVPLSTVGKYRELIKRLRSHYPGHEWEEKKFYMQGEKRASQRMVRVQVELLFPESGKVDGVGWFC